MLNRLAELARLRPTLDEALLKVSPAGATDLHQLPVGTELQSRPTAQESGLAHDGHAAPPQPRAPAIGHELVLLDHDQSVGALVQRVELNPPFAVNSDDCFLESLDHLGAVFENRIGRDHDDNAHVRLSPPDHS